MTTRERTTTTTRKIAQLMTYGTKSSAEIYLLPVPEP